MFSQTKSVRGTVLNDSGEPIIGATILVKGTNTGTTTDMEGNFTLNVQADRKTLVISYIGMATKEVEVASNIAVTLSSNSKLDEVVVTAMGIKRSEKAIGSSSTTVTSDEITQARASDLLSGLSGKIAGVQVSSSSSDPGASTSVVIRGFSSLNGNNQPLYIVDGVPVNNSARYSSDGLNSSFDFGNGINAVNPEDVDAMTVLKGAAATALYGSRAANGVVLITTKSGKKQHGIGIEYNGGIQFSNILKLPEFQNEFGMGWYGLHTEIENGSWGPKFDGSMQLWGSVYTYTKDQIPYAVQKIKPYVALENNLKDFFDTGFRYSNSLAFNGATDKSEYYVSFSQLSDNGMLPTNSDTFDRYTFSTRASHKTGALKISESINYSTQKNNFAATGQGLSMVNALYQTPRDVSLIGLENLNDPFNTPNWYYTPYGITNPYYVLENEENTYQYDKLFGKLEASYDFLNNFNLTYRLGLDYNTGETKLGTPDYKTIIQENNSSPDNYAQYKTTNGRVAKTMERRRELNHDLLLSYNKQITDFSVNGLVGLNVNERKYSWLTASVSGLDMPLWYNLSNSSATPTVEEYESKRRLYGIFGSAEVGYRDFLYLTLVARNDWSSTLPKNNNSFFYPGVTGSFVFSELLNEDLKKIISFGKVRAAWGQTGNDADVYSIYPEYAQNAVNLGFGSVTFPLSDGTSSYNAFTLVNQLGNPTLQPEITTEIEFGANVAFLKNRISFDIAYYNRNSDKQIFPLNMDPATGYTTQVVNLGKISNKGVELLVNVRPLEFKDFSWDVSWNFTKNNSKVEKLAEQLGGSALIYGITGATGMYAIEGMPIGVYKAYVAERDPNGNIVVDASTGLPVATAEQQIVGDINYDYEMGFSTDIKYKDFTLHADLDVRQGGLMYSRTKNISYFTGNAIQTTYNDRNTFIVPGSVNKVENGVDANGNTVYAYVENTTAITKAKVYDFWNNGGLDMGASDLIDKSYVKLRSISFGWDLPKNWLRKTPLQAVNFSVYGTNLFIWTPASNTFIDPEVSTFGNDLVGKYGEFSANPTSRKYGFNVKVKF